VIAGSEFLPFLLTVYVLILIPGPSVLFVVGRGVALGRRAAVATVVGNSAGLAVQLALVAIGLGAIVADSDSVFTGLKLAGAAYLVFLGIRNIRERAHLSAAFGSGASAPKSLKTLIREGFTVGITNPKGILIFTVIVPQFVDRAEGHVTLQLATLGGISVVLGMLSDMAWGLAAGTARSWLGSSSKRLERLTATGGVMLVGLGVGLALTGRRS
jgi:threonine/homoserine/homoserine lactone efflux protein